MQITLFQVVYNFISQPIKDFRNSWIHLIRLFKSLTNFFNSTKALLYLIFKFPKFKRDLRHSKATKLYNPASSHSQHNQSGFSTRIKWNRTKIWATNRHIPYSTPVRVYQRDFPEIREQINKPAAKYRPQSETRRPRLNQISENHL